MVIPVRDESGAIDLVYILRLLRKKFIWIILAAAVGGVLFYCYARFFVTPLYTSTISFYVSSHQLATAAPDATVPPDSAITSTQIAAAKELIKTYGVILKDTSVTSVISDSIGNRFSPGEISSMISVSAVADSTIMRVSVTCADPKAAEEICNYLDEIGSAKISEVTNSGYIHSIDKASFPKAPSSPNIKRYLFIGVLLGIVLSCTIIIVIGMLDNTVKSEEELEQRLHVPVLGKIPAVEASQNNYGYKQRGGYR